MRRRSCSTRRTPLWSELDDAPLLSVWSRETRAALDDAGERRSAYGLTRAELRTLQYLPTHLSFREIGERLFLSANTVKTQARAVYRKLDATSRAETVQKAREAGLLSGEDAAASPPGLIEISPSPLRRRARGRRGC